MEVLDIFSGDAFSIASLTDTVNHSDYKPSMISALRLFQEEGIPTRTVIIEEEFQTIKLVQTAPFGGVAEPRTVDQRKARSFVVPHLPLGAAITAEEIQNIRAYAAGMTPQQALLAVEQLRNKKLTVLRDDLETTLEFHKVGAIKGKILDADGSTIFDLFSQFNVIQQTLNMVLGTATTNVNQKIRAAIRLSLDALKNTPVTGWAAICSDTFFDDLISHAKVEDKYLNWQAAADLSQSHRAFGSFDFGGVSWMNYRGEIGTTKFVEDDFAYLFPVGARGVFIGKFGPSDYIDRVNQIPSPDGLPIEVRSEMKRMGKGVDIEAQSNPLYLCTKPRAIIKLHKHNG